MSLTTAALILAIASALALLLASPLIYLLRKKRRHPREVAPGPAEQPLTWLQALPGMLIVVAMFFAFAAEYFAPESWFGQRMAAMGGKFWFFMLVWLALFAIDRAVRELMNRQKLRDKSQ